MQVILSFFHPISTYLKSDLMKLKIVASALVSYNTNSPAVFRAAPGGRALSCNTRFFHFPPSEAKNLLILKDYVRMRGFFIAMQAY